MYVTNLQLLNCIAFYAQPINNKQFSLQIMSIAFNGISHLRTSTIKLDINNPSIMTNSVTISRQPKIVRYMKSSNKIISEKKLTQSTQKNKNNFSDKYQNPFIESYNRKNTFSPSNKRAATAKSTGRQRQRYRYNKKTQLANNNTQEQDHNLKQIINICQKKILDSPKKPTFQKYKTEEYQFGTRRSLMVSANKKNREKIHTLNAPMTKSCKLNKNQIASQKLRSSTTTSKEIKNQSTARKTLGTNFLTCKKLKSQDKQIYYNQCLSSLLIQREINLRLNNQFEEQRFQKLINKIKGKQQPQSENFQDDGHQFMIFNKFGKSLQTDIKNQTLQKSGQSSPIFLKCMINPQNQFSHSFSRYRQKAKNSIFKSALQWSNKRVNVMKTSREKTLKQSLKQKKQQFQIDINIDRWQGNNDVELIPPQKYQK